MKKTKHRAIVYSQLWPKVRTRNWPKHDPDPKNCTGAGQRKCLKQDEHSWFNHSMDSYHANPGLSNIPPGYEGIDD